MFTLIIYIYAGMMAQGDSVALTHVDDFKTLAECTAAGDQTKRLVTGSAKEVRYVCLKK